MVILVPFNTIPAPLPSLIFTSSTHLPAGWIKKFVTFNEPVPASGIPVVLSIINIISSSFSICCEGEGEKSLSSRVIVLYLRILLPEVIKPILYKSPLELISLVTIKEPVISALPFRVPSHSLVTPVN